MTHQPIHCPATTRMWPHWTLLRDAKTDAAPAYVNVRQFHKSHLGRGNVTKKVWSLNEWRHHICIICPRFCILGNHEWSSVSDSSDDFHLPDHVICYPRPHRDRGSSSVIWCWQFWHSWLYVTSVVVLQTILRIHNRFSQSRRRLLLVESAYTY